jgi:hypothetical protein
MAGLTMAFCPKCKAAIGMTATICPHCGFDFPQTELPVEKRGWEHSGFADFSLLVGAYCSLMCALVTGGVAVKDIVFGQFLAGGMGLLSATVMFALFVAFLRVR